MERGVHRPITYISLDPPYRLEAGQETFVFSGWAEVDDIDAPQVDFLVNGVRAPVLTEPRPQIQRHFPGMLAHTVRAKVSFADLLANVEPQSATFLIEATVVSDHRRRTFEYAVSEAWMEGVFGRRLKPRPTPPEPLQIRVAGAAAGEYHATGRATAAQIGGLLAANGLPLSGFRRILDFGCGPGRLIAPMRDLAPEARFTGSDIDPQAIAWAQKNLGDLGDFHATGANPPLPFDDASFDLIYGMSVFTHLPRDMQFPWLAELRRVLAPGGVLITSKLDPNAYPLPEDVHAAAARDGFVYWGEAPATDGLPDFYRLAYHTADYIRREWSRGFEVLHVGSHDVNDTQDAVILRRA